MAHDAISPEPLGASAALATPKLRSWISALLPAQQIIVSPSLT